MARTAESTIDRAGRVVIPSELREKAGLKPGTPLQVTLRDGHVEIEPLPRRVRIVRRGKFSVAVPEEQSEPLTNDQVTQTLDDLRDERGK